MGETIPGGKGTYLPQAVINFDRSSDGIFNRRGKVGTTFRQVFAPIVKPGSTINSTINKEPSHFENTSLNNPVVYSPQVGAMLVSKLFNLSVAQTFYLARLAGLLFWLIVCYYGLKKMKLFGWAGLALLLTPLSLQLASSVSADTVTIAITVFLVGFLIDKLVTHNPLTRKQLLQLFILILFLACIKSPFFLLGLLFFLLPAQLFPGKQKQRAAILLAAFATMLIITVGWIAISHRGYVPFKTIATGLPHSESANAKYIIEHPLSFARKVYDTNLVPVPYSKNYVPYNQDLVLGYGGILSNLSYGLPGWAIATYFILLGAVFTVFIHGAKATEFISRLGRLSVFGLVVALCLLVDAALFITWSSPDLPYIDGLQSRYFIPAVIPLLLCLLPLRKKGFAISTNFRRLVPICLILIHLLAAIAVYQRFYLPL